MRVTGAGRRFGQIKTHQPPQVHREQVDMVWRRQCAVGACVTRPRSCPHAAIAVIPAVAKNVAAAGIEARKIGLMSVDKCLHHLIETARAAAGDGPAVHLRVAAAAPHLVIEFSSLPFEPLQVHWAVQQDAEEFALHGAEHLRLARVVDRERRIDIDPERDAQLLGLNVVSHEAGAVLGDVALAQGDLPPVLGHSPHKRLCETESAGAHSVQH